MKVKLFKLSLFVIATAINKLLHIQVSHFLFVRNTAMHINRSESTPLRALSNSAVRPVITFNYCTPLVVLPAHSKPDLARPPSSTAFNQLNQGAFMNSFSQQVQGRRDSRRKKIFADSHSSIESFGLSRPDHQLQKHSAQNWQARGSSPHSPHKELKSKSQRKRNSIFQSYHSKVPEAKFQIDKNHKQLITHYASSQEFAMNFQRPAHPKRLTNYFQLTPNRITIRNQEQTTPVLLNAESYISKIPLRNTYVAQRDWETTAVQPKQPSGILENELYEIPFKKTGEPFTKKLQQDSFTKKAHLQQLKPRERQQPVHNLQFEKESINGYSHRQLNAHEDPLEDMPDLLLETNQQKAAFKHDKMEQFRPRPQPYSSVDIWLQTSHSQRSEAGSKDLAMNSESPAKTENTMKRSGLEAIPYLLVAFGMLLLIIQLLK